MRPKQKIIVVVGPTGSGKTKKAIELARTLGGEIISADSRQVYRGLDIGTEKATRREMCGVPHHCIDIASPKRPFSAAQWKKCAERAIADIASRGKVPIVAGGTGFYVDLLLGNIAAPEVGPNNALRKRLERQSARKLFTSLMEKDPRRARQIEKRDEGNNKRRIIRALEIAEALGAVPKQKPQKHAYDVEIIYLEVADEELRQRLETRLDATLRKGLVAETRKLRDELGLSWQRIDELGLEYRIVAKYLRKEISKEEMRQELLAKLWQYAKRQKGWWRRPAH